jgi:LysM repeat protein
VRRSETLWKIAERYGTTPARIRAANGLTSSVIHPGQTLEIPDSF